MLSRSLARIPVHLLAAAYFLALIIAEAYEAMSQVPSIPLSVPTMAALASMFILLGIPVAVWRRLVYPRQLFGLLTFAVFAAFLSIFYQASTDPATSSYCGIQTVFQGFPFPFRQHLSSVDLADCPALVLPLPPRYWSGSSMAAFGVDLLFYLGLGLAVLQQNSES